MAHSNQIQVKSKKTGPQRPEIVWAVVIVESGIPVTVEAYYDMKTAKRRERFFRKGLREDYDEVGVFQVEIGSPSST